MMNATLMGKPDAGNPHVAPTLRYGVTGRFDEGKVASVKPRRGSLLYKAITIKMVAGLSLALFPLGGSATTVATNVWTGAAGNGTWSDAANWTSNVDPIDLAQPAVWDFTAAADGATITWADTDHPAAIYSIICPQRAGSLTLAASADSIRATFPANDALNSFIKLYSGFTLEFGLPYEYDSTRDGAKVKSISVSNKGTLRINPRNGVFINGSSANRCRPITMTGNTTLLIGSKCAVTENFYYYWSQPSATARFECNGNMGHPIVWTTGIIDINAHTNVLTVNKTDWSGSLKPIQCTGTGEVQLEKYTAYSRMFAPQPGSALKFTAVTSGESVCEGLKWTSDTWLNLVGTGYFSFDSDQSVGTISGSSALGQIRYETPGALQTTSDRDSAFAGGLTNVTELVKSGTGALAFSGDGSGVTSLKVKGGRFSMASGTRPSNALTQLLFGDEDVGYDTAVGRSTWSVVGVKENVSRVSGGVTGKALRVDCTTNESDYTYLSYTATGDARADAMPAGNESLTFSAWLKPDSTAVSGRSKGIYDILNYGSSWHYTRTLWIYYESQAIYNERQIERLCLGTGGRNLCGYTFPTGSSLMDGAWHHLVVTYDGSARVWKMYIDGVLGSYSTVQTVENTFTKNEPLCLGFRARNNVYAGLFDDVSFGKGCWSAEDVAAEYANKRTSYVAVLPAPVAHYAFEDASNPGKDSSGNGYDLTLYGTASVENCWRPGAKAGKCLKIADGYSAGTGVNYLSFDGETYPAKLPQGTNSFSVAVRHTDGGNAEGMAVIAFGDHTVSNAHFDVGIYGSPRDFGANWIHIGTGDVLARKQSVYAGDTYHVERKNTPAEEMGWAQFTYVYRAAEKTLYIYRDGAYLKKQVLTTPLDLGAKHLTSCIRQDFRTHNFQGLIDDIRIFDCALDPNEVMAVARDQAGLSTAAFPTTLTAQVDAGATLDIRSTRTLRSVENNGSINVAERATLTLSEASVFAGTVNGGDIVVPAGSTVTANRTEGAFVGVDKLTLPATMTIRLSETPAGTDVVRYRLASAGAFVLPEGFSRRYSGWTVETAAEYRPTFACSDGILSVDLHPSGFALIFR